MGRIFGCTAAISWLLVTAPCWATLPGCSSVRGLRVENAKGHEGPRRTELVVLGAQTLAYVWKYVSRHSGSALLRSPGDEQLAWDELKRRLGPPEAAVRSSFEASLAMTGLFSFEHASVRGPSRSSEVKGGERCPERDSTVGLPGTQNSVAEWVMIIDVHAVGLFLPRSEPNRELPSSGTFGVGPAGEAMATALTNAVIDSQSKEFNASHTWLAGLEGCLYLVARSTQKVIASGPIAAHLELEPDELKACRKSATPETVTDPHLRTRPPSHEWKSCGSTDLSDATLQRFPHTLATAIAMTARDTTVAMTSGQSQIKQATQKRYPALVAHAEQLLVTPAVSAQLESSEVARP